MNNFNKRVDRLKEQASQYGGLWKLTYSDGHTCTLPALRAYLELLALAGAEKELPLAQKLDDIVSPSDKYIHMLIDQ